MTDTNHIQPKVVAFIDQRELSVVKHVLKAMRDCIDLKHEIGLPVLAKTREAIDELEGMIVSLKLELLRSPHPDQLMLPGMDGLVATGTHHRTDSSAVASAKVNPHKSSPDSSRTALTRYSRSHGSSCKSARISRAANSSIV